MGDELTIIRHEAEWIEASPENPAKVQSRASAIRRAVAGADEVIRGLHETIASHEKSWREAESKAERYIGLYEVETKRLEEAEVAHERERRGDRIAIRKLMKALEDVQAQKRSTEAALDLAERRADAIRAHLFLPEEARWILSSLSREFREKYPDTFEKLGNIARG